MFRNLFEGPGLIIILVIVLLLFGATRLPALARSIGKSTRILRDEVRGQGDGDDGDGEKRVADPDAPKAKTEATSTDRGASDKT